MARPTAYDVEHERWLDDRQELDEMTCGCCGQHGWPPRGAIERETHCLECGAVECLDCEAHGHWPEEHGYCPACHEEARLAHEEECGGVCRGCLGVES